MFRGVKRLMRSHRERVFSLVLLPAFLLGTLPHTDCICGDGHREPFCTPGHCRACLSRSSASGAGGHSCCKSHASSEKPSCCAGKQCERSPAGGPTSVAAKQGCCCKGIIEVPTPVTLAKKSELTGHSMVAAILESPQTYVSAAELWPSFECVSRSMPPPLDAVIVYLHLTI